MLARLSFRLCTWVSLSAVIAACGSSTNAPGGIGNGEASAASGGAPNGGVASFGGGAPNGGASAASGGTPGSTTGGQSALDASSPLSLVELQQNFVDLRFGMFIHFGILTYTGSWSQANLDITQFNPTDLNPGQWADAAASAHMKYGVLTTRHHDGFALWPSAASNFNVGHIPWRSGQGDVVREYVNAFRSRGLLPGLYYSIWDNTEGIGNGAITASQMEYVKTQLTELLTNYGPIPILVMDGWSWKMGHHDVAYEEIRALIKSLQPNCLVTDHTHLADPWDVDIVNFEEPSGAWAPTTNNYPAQQGNKINSSGGNDWFWAPNIGGLMSVSDVVTSHLAKLEPVWTNFLLNCPPNRTGQLDSAIVSVLSQVGSTWSPNTARAPLPAQEPQNEHPYTPVTASATSGNAALAIDGRNDTSFNTSWVPSAPLPQSITLDLGTVRPDVGWLGAVPRYSGQKAGSDGNITSYGVLLSSDGSNFTEVASGTWPADARMHAVTFGPASARYVRLEVRAANGAAPVATEVTVGAR